MSPLARPRLSFVVASASALLGLLCSACASLPVEDTTTGPVVRISGRVVYAEPPAPWAGATLRVALLDLGQAEATQAIVAYQDQEPTGRRWSAFLLQVPATLIDRRRSYGLSARITDAMGRVLWATDRAHPVDLDAPGAVELVVRPAPGPPAPSASSAPPAERTLSFHCGEFTVTVHLERDRARLVLPDRTIVLDRAPGQAEPEYGQAGSRLRVEGSALFLELGGKVYRDCEPRAPSP